MLMRSREKTYGVVLCLCAFAVGCGSKHAETTASKATIELKNIEPAFTLQQEGFHPQPAGHSVIIAYGEAFSSDAVILWNGQPLKTVNRGNWLAGEVAPELFSKPGVAQIKVRTLSGSASRELPFTIYPKEGPKPEITRLDPDGTRAGEVFHVQPDGGAAIAVLGKNFLPHCRVMFDGQAMETQFVSDVQVHARVPAAIYAKAKTCSVQVRNLDGKLSDPSPFRVTAGPR